MPAFLLNESFLQEEAELRLEEVEGRHQRELGEAMEALAAATTAAAAEGRRARELEARVGALEEGKRKEEEAACLLAAPLGGRLGGLMPRPSAGAPQQQQPAATSLPASRPVLGDRSNRPLPQPQPLSWMDGDRASSKPRVTATAFKAQIIPGQSGPTAPASVASAPDLASDVDRLALLPDEYLENVLRGLDLSR